MTKTFIGNVRGRQGERGPAGDASPEMIAAAESRAESVAAEIVAPAVTAEINARNIPSQVAGQVAAQVTPAVLAAGRAAAVQAISEDPTVANAAASFAQSAAGLVRKVDLDDDVLHVQFENADGTTSPPFIEADEARGIFSKITHRPGSIPTGAADYLIEFSPESGWAWGFVWRDGDGRIRLRFGQRLDGSMYPSLATGAGSVTDAMLTPEVRARLAPVKTGAPVSVWGDSRSAGGSGFGTLLSAEIGNVPVYVDAIGGQTSDQIAARQGGRADRVTIANNIIPTSGPVGLTTAYGSLDRPSGGAVSRRGSIMGVPGVLTCDNPGGVVYTFTRDTPGAEVWVSPGTPFIGELATAARSSVQVILSGRNSVNKAGVTPAMIAERAEQMIRHMQGNGGRYLLLEDYPADGDTIGTPRRAALDEMNRLYQELAGPNFVRTAPYLMTRALSDLGLTPTSADTEALNRGVVPPTLNPDGVHLTVDANRMLARHVVARELTTRGWI